MDTATTDSFRDADAILNTQLCDVLCGGKDELAPYNRLPEEILVEIFMIHTALTRRLRGPQSYEWIRVTHICAWWRQAALRCPTLWARNIVIKPNVEECIKEFLIRSRDIPLHVHAEFSGTYEEDIYDDEDSEVDPARIICSFNLVLEQLHRISHLIFNQPPGISRRLFKFKDVAAPMLRTLKLRDWEGDFYIPLFQAGGLPVLELLCLADLHYLGVKPLFAPTITCLILFRCMFPSETKLLTVLAAMPMMEEAVLQPRYDILGDGFVVCRWPHLKSLHLFCNPERVNCVENTLDHLIFPPTARLTIHLASDISPPVALPDSPLIRSIQAKIAAITERNGPFKRVCIDNKDRTWGLHMLEMRCWTHQAESEASFRVLCQGGYITGVENIRSICNSLSFNAVEDLTVAPTELIGQSIESELWLEIFSVWTGVKELTIHASFSKHLISTLLYRRPSPDKITYDVRFPALRKLTINTATAVHHPHQQYYLFTNRLTDILGFMRAVDKILHRRTEWGLERTTLVPIN